MIHFLQELDDLLARRKAELPEGSYTSSLFQAGLDRMLKKIGEEAGEVIIAAKNHDPKELTHEAADLLFHLMVVLRQEGLDLNAVVAELRRRHSK